MLKMEAAKLGQGEITKITYDNTKYGLEKLVLPHFKTMDVAVINYVALAGYLGTLSKQSPSLCLATIGAYMGLVKGSSRRVVR
jgi:hypothetical protein